MTVNGVPSLGPAAAIVRVHLAGLDQHGLGSIGKHEGLAERALYVDVLNQGTGGREGRARARNVLELVEGGPGRPDPVVISEAW